MVTLLIFVVAALFIGLVAYSAWIQPTYQERRVREMEQNRRLLLWRKNQELLRGYRNRGR